MSGARAIGALDRSAPPIIWAMRYAVDLGNSAAKVGWLENGARRSIRMAAPSGRISAAAWYPHIASLLDLAFSEGGGSDTLTFASVVPAAAEALRTLAAERAIGVHEITAIDVPLKIALDAPERLGVDRALGAWRAYATWGAPQGRGAIAVTLGTALTLTCVTRAGAIIGGAIAPSPVLAARALAVGTAALPEITLFDESPDLPGPVGATTDSAIAAGILRGARATLAALVEESAKEMGRRDPGAPRPAIVLAGGAATAGWSAGVEADARETELVLDAILALAVGSAPTTSVPKGPR